MLTSSTESKIDTKLFLLTAESLKSVENEMKSCFQEWAKVTQSLRGIWQGETSDQIKHTSDSVLKSAEVLLHCVGNYRVVLNEMAGIYENTEKNVQEAGKSLKFDKIR